MKSIITFLLFSFVGVAKEDPIAVLRKAGLDISAGQVTEETLRVAAQAKDSLPVALHDPGFSTGQSPEPNLQPGTLITHALITGKPAVQCQPVRNGLAQAKLYWSELLCITKKVLQASKARYPDMNYIFQLTERAKTLNAWIEQVFPSRWDEEDLHLIHRWTPISGELHGFETENLDWRGTRWVGDALPDAFAVEVKDNAIEVIHTLSTTNYCLELQNATLRGHVTVVREGDPNEVNHPLVVWLPHVSRLTRTPG